MASISVFRSLKYTGTAAAFEVMPWGRVGGIYFVISGTQRASEQHVPLSKAPYSSYSRHLTGTSLRKSKQ